MMEYRKDVTGVHLYSYGLEFPVILYEKGQWDRTQISYLDTTRHTTESLMQWAKAHRIDSEVISPLAYTKPLKHPIRFLRYLGLKHRLKHT